MRVDEGPQLILSQFSSLLNMVGAGVGVSVIPEMAVEKNSRCHYVRIADESARRTIGATVLRGRFLTRVFRRFLAHLHPAI